MINKKTLIIAKREFLNVVKQKTFILLTFGIPLFFMLITFFSLYHSFFLVNEISENLKEIGIVDYSTIMGKHQKKEPIQYAPFDKTNITSGNKVNITSNKLLINTLNIHYYTKVEDGIKDLATNRINNLYVIPKNYVQEGIIKSYSKKSSLLMGGDNFIEWILRKHLLKDKINPSIINRIEHPVDLNHYILNDKNKAIREDKIKLWGSLLLPYIASGIMMLTIFIPASYLLQSVSEEKESKIIEILVSSVTYDELLTGKLIGLGSAGLIQATVWLAFITVPFSIWLVLFEISIMHVLLCFVYIVLGFLLFGSLMICIGSLGLDGKQTNQMAGFCSLLSIIPLLFMPIVVLHPNGITARILSYIPFTSPVTMMIRLATNKSDPIDFVITFLILVPTVYLLLKGASRIFKTGALMYGKNITAKEVIKCFIKG